MKNIKIWLVLLSLGLVLVSATGCRRGPPAPVDPDKARELLRTTLDAWQQGQSADALQQQSSITAADPKWKEGHRLIRYEITRDKVAGCDLLAHVLLVLQGPDGKQAEERAVFTVSTSPAVVVRGDG